MYYRLKLRAQFVGKINSLFYWAHKKFFQIKGQL